VKDGERYESNRATIGRSLKKQKPTRGKNSKKGVFSSLGRTDKRKKEELTGSLFLKNFAPKKVSNVGSAGTEFATETNIQYCCGIKDTEVH